MANKLYAVIDPNWGDRKIIPETVRNTPEESIDVVLTMSDHSLYHGGSNSCVPVLRGEWEKIQRYGYYVSEITVEIGK
jgi:hypothetical protein